MSFNFSFSYDYYPITGFQGVPTTAVTTDGSITVKFYPIWYKQVTMEWSIPASWGACTFNVYKSANGDGPFEQVNQTPITGTFFKDLTTEAFSKFGRDFYVVEVILPSGQTTRSPASSWQKIRRKDVELKALDIQRREYLLLSKYTGVESLVFSRRTYGKRCLLCWNPTTERVMNDACPSCLGTSFEGGYFPGISSFIQYEPTPNSVTLTYFGKFEPNQIGAWTISYPEINPHDLIVRLSDWKVYRVEAIQSTELLTVSVRQIMQITELDKESVEYQLITKDPTVFPAGYVN
jgi:hypothetical protein